MRTYDLTPLFRSSIGFDRLMRVIDTSLRIEEGSGSSSYPPYNIEKLNENIYRLTMAVAGFREEELTITLQDNVLLVSGKAQAEEEEIQYLYRGIARRAFDRQFQLADFIKVGDASLENGLLRILLKSEIPETLKPQVIKILKPSSQNKLIEHK